MTARVGVLTVAMGALIAAPAAQAATVKNGPPSLKSFRGKPLAVVFFHPL